MTSIKMNDEINSTLPHSHRVHFQGKPSWYNWSSKFVNKRENWKLENLPWNFLFEIALCWIMGVHQYESSNIGEQIKERQTQHCNTLIHDTLVRLLPVLLIFSIKQGAKFNYWRWRLRINYTGYVCLCVSPPEVTQQIFFSLFTHKDFQVSTGFPAT